MTIAQGTRSNQESRYSIFDDDPIDVDDVTIIIPTLNEEMAIGNVIEAIMNEGFRNIFVVDGHSDDGTLDIASQYKVKILEQLGSGKTGALKTAIDHVKTPYLVIIDGDMTYDAKDINKFLPHLKYYDEIIGARINGRDNIPKFNRFGNWVINKAFNLFFGTNLTDVCSGLYALDTIFAQNLMLYTNGFDVEVEIAAQAAWGGMISQIPISYGKRIGKQKLQPIKDGSKILYTIFKQGRVYNPVLIFSAMTAFTLIPAILLLGWSFLKWLQGTLYFEFSLLGFILLILGIQAINLGIISTQHKRIEQRLLRQAKNRR